MACLNQEFLLQRSVTIIAVISPIIWNLIIFSPFLKTSQLFHTGVRVACEVLQRTSTRQQDQRGNTTGALLILCLRSHLASPPSLCSSFPELPTICGTNHNFFCLHKALPPAWILLPANSSILGGLILDATSSRKTLLITPSLPSVLLCDIYSLILA